MPGVSSIFYGKLWGIFSISLGWGCWCFWTSILYHHALETENNLFYLLLSAGCVSWNLFGRDVQKFQIFSWSHQRWALLWWRFSAVLNSVDVAIEVGGIAVARQLLRWQQNVVCFSYRQIFVTFWLPFFSSVQANRTQ